MIYFLHITGRREAERREEERQESDQVRRASGKANYAAGYRVGRRTGYREGYEAGRDADAARRLRETKQKVGTYLAAHGVSASATADNPG